MNKYSVPYTLNPNSEYVFVCEGPSYQDLKSKQLLTPWSPAGKVFKAALAERGIIAQKCSVLAVSRARPFGGAFHAHNNNTLSAEIAELRKTLGKLNPKVVVAMGDYAAWALLPNDWPTKRNTGRIKDAEGMLDMRGFVFTSQYTPAPVVATVDPELIHKMWVPWRVLFSLDLQRAKNITKEGFTRPKREVEIL